MLYSECYISYATHHTSFCYIHQMNVVLKYLVISVFPLQAN